MQRIILFLSLTIWSTRLFAQDTLITRHKIIIPAKIIEITDTQVLYKSPNDLNGPIFKADRSDISKIKLSNGVEYSPKKKSKREQNEEDPTNPDRKDSTGEIVLKNSHYAILGAGVSKFSYAGSLGYSGTFKTHVFSIRSEAATYNSNSQYSRLMYVGALFGESLRSKHIFTSLSIGLGIVHAESYDKFTYSYMSSGAYGGSTYHSGIATKNEFYYRGPAMPMEFNFFILARNYFGMGLKLSDIWMVSTTHHDTTAMLCLVFGLWNTAKKQLN